MPIFQTVSEIYAHLGKAAVEIANTMHVAGVPLPYALMVSLVDVEDARQGRMFGDFLEPADPAFGFTDRIIAPVEQLIETDPSEAVHAYKRAMTDIAWAIRLPDWEASVHDHVNF